MKIIKTFSKKGLPCKAHIVKFSFGTLGVMVENKEGLTDFPSIYNNGSIAYDNPNWYPNYAKQLVKKAFAELRKESR